jgi:hypothetical protein
MMEQQEKRSYLAYQDFKDGMIITEICKKHACHVDSIYPYFKKFMAAETTRIILTVSGHKSEPYYKEESEMLADRVYTYEGLSDREKWFYEGRQSLQQQ